MLPFPLRADMTPVRYVTRANKTQLLKDLDLPGERARTLAEFDADVYSAGSDEVRMYQLATWMELHDAWFKGSVAPFPLAEARFAAWPRASSARTTDPSPTTRRGQHDIGKQVEDWQLLIRTCLDGTSS